MWLWLNNFHKISFWRITVSVDHVYKFSFSLTEAITSKSTSGLTDITWSSSGSDLSDEDKTILKSQRDDEHGSKIDRFCDRNTSCPEDGASEGKLIIL